MTTTTSKPRGFAAMAPEVRRAIAAKGGANVPHHKRSFSTDRDLAAKAGKRGGEASAGGAHRADKAADRG